MGIANLKYFQEAYPNIIFTKRYDIYADDWIVTLNIPLSSDKTDADKIISFYWANASLIPASQIQNKENYTSLLYIYPKEMQDPADYTEEQKEELKEYSSKESRKTGAGTAMFFFNELYDSASQRDVEKHIVKLQLLGKRTNIHELIKEPLLRVEKKIYELAKTNSEVKDFLNNIKSIDGYHWRIIDGTDRPSFHSLGMAIDILPKSQKGKQIFWSWAKDKYPNTWMLIPLKDRWSPPLCVVQAFEEEGFIWGGKWAIWDNMHFEYHPELIKYNQITSQTD